MSIPEVAVYSKQINLEIRFLIVLLKNIFALLIRGILLTY